MAKLHMFHSSSKTFAIDVVHSIERSGVVIVIALKLEENLLTVDCVSLP